MSSAPIFDREILIAEYTLGLLNAHETSQAQQLLGEDIQAATTALKWENNFLDLVDLLPPVNPGPQSLQRLQTTLGHTPRQSTRHLSAVADSKIAAPAPAPVPAQVNAAARSPSASLPGKHEQETLTVAAALRTREKSPDRSHNESPVPVPAAPTPKTTPQPIPKPMSAVQPPPEPASGTRSGNIWLWRIASGIFASIAIVMGLMPSEPVAPPITVVEVAPTQAAILQSPGQSSTPGWVVTIDPQGNVLMNPQVRSDIPADASVQLWTHNKTMPQPRSLGLIDINQPVTVPASLMGDISPDQIFEMTQEPAGGSPTASPSGPILFIGRIVTFGRPAISPSAGIPPPPT